MEARYLVRACFVYADVDEFIADGLVSLNIKDSLSKEASQWVIDRFAHTRNWDLPHLVAAAVYRCLIESAESIDDKGSGLAAKTSDS